MGEKERSPETAEETERRLNGLPPGSPIPPAGIAIGDPGVNGNIAEGGNESAINNSHSNLKNLRESPATGSAGRTEVADGDAGVTDSFAAADSPAERGSNLNMSKSNIDRLSDPGDGPTAEATTVKSSKSNSSE